MARSSTTFPSSRELTPEQVRDKHAPVELTDEQKVAFIAVIAHTTEQGETIGNEAALRLIGVTGSKTSVRASIDDELKLAAKLARGWDLTRVKDARWGVAVDTKHKDWEKANYSLLRAYGGPEWRDEGTLSIEHGGLVRVEHERRLTLADVAAFARSLDGSEFGVVDGVSGARVVAELGEGESSAGDASS